MREFGYPVAACRDHERVRFRYTAHDEAVSRRISEPHRLVSAGRRCVLHASTDSLEWLAMVLGVLDVDFEVVEPPALADCIRAVGARLARSVS